MKCQAKQAADKTILTINMPSSLHFTRQKASSCLDQPNTTKKGQIAQKASNSRVANLNKKTHKRAYPCTPWQRGFGRRETSNSRLSLAQRASQNLLQVTERHEARCRLQLQSFPVVTSATVSGSTSFLL